MRAMLVTVIVCAFLVGCGGSAFGRASDETSLRIAFWDDKATTHPSVIWMLQCDPAQGSLPRPARACGRLVAGGTKLFAPLPKDVACIEIYGGPQKARVTGTIDGKRIWATFSRTDGCEIARWNRIAPWLVPPGGVS